MTAIEKKESTVLPTYCPDQTVLNFLRYERGMKDLREHRISMRSLKRLLQRGRVVRRKSWNNGNEKYLYRTLVTEEFPFQFRCTGSFCSGLNIHGDRRHILCKPCRLAKLRHNKTERSRPANVQRANRTRRILRYNKRMELLRSFQGQFNRPRGLNLFRRVLGFTKEEFSTRFPALRKQE